MKIKENLQQLRGEAVHLLGLFFQAEKELENEVKDSANGFFDPQLLVKREQAYKAWQIAENKFQHFLSYCHQNKLDPEMELDNHVNQN
jgi:hypothetical protein